VLVLKREKLGIAAAGQRLGEVHDSLRADQHKAKMIFVPLLVAFAASCFLLPPVGFIGVIITGAIFANKHAKLKRSLEKLDFVRELHGRLEDELQPRRPIHLDFDLRHYDEASKMVWQGRSSHGNAKYKYSDKWLHYRGTLADGTRFEVVRQAGVKTKKGAVVKEKRRLFLEVLPDPRRYDLSLLKEPRPRQRLRARLDVATGAFHDTPEEFHARVEAAGGLLKLKVTQEDAPILPVEVVTILEEVVRFLQELRRDRPQADPKADADPAPRRDDHDRVRG
jgi:hypothetical protein